MAQENSGNVMLTDIPVKEGRGLHRCRIPQRLETGKQKPPQIKQIRPKSANRTKTEAPPPKSLDQIRSGNSNNAKKQPLKRPLTPQRVLKQNLAQKENSRPVIMVPIAQKHPQKTVYTNRAMSALPDQETINRHEHLEMQQRDRENLKTNSDLNETESITSRHEEVTQLKIIWQEKIIEFEKMKTAFNERQRSLLELYSALGMTHRKMTALGEKAKLPDKLQLMNVAHLTPEQLLQLCSHIHLSPDVNADGGLQNKRLDLGVNLEVIFNTSTKLVDTCKQTLCKRKEIINILLSLTNSKQTVTQGQLLKKVKEFNADNEMIYYSLDKVSDEFFAELKNIVNLLEKSTNDKMNLQVSNEQMLYKISELCSQKEDLQKKLHNVESRKPNVGRKEIKELQQQLKEEQCMRKLVKNKMYRTEGQLKNNAEQVSQLQAVLEQTRSQNWSLERTVQELRDQNQKLQGEFEKLTHSIRENTSHLEEIAEAREKLQLEKEDLKNQLADLSTQYNESIKNMKTEINCNVASIIEFENKYENEKEKRLQIEGKTETLCTQLCETELRYKNICKQLHDKELRISKNVDELKEFEANRQELISVKQKLESLMKEIESYQARLVHQSDHMKEIEMNFKQSLSLEKDLKSQLRINQEYITELEKKIILLEQQLQESECDKNSNEEELSLLKLHINKLQSDFGEFGNLSELRDTVNEQRAKLFAATKQNSDLAEALQKKDLEIKREIELLSEKEIMIKKRDAIIKMLTEKEEEQANIIKLLRNNLEMRTQADVNFNQKLMDKNAEIDSLIRNVNQLEKIILTLEDEKIQADVQRKKDAATITFLESKIADHETFYSINRRKIGEQTENLDSLIKKLEDEMGTLLDDGVSHSDQLYNINRDFNNYNRKQKENKEDECYEDVNTTLLCEDLEKSPTSNNYKTPFDKFKHIRENAVVETRKWVSTAGHGLNVFDFPLAADNRKSRRGKFVSPKTANTPKECSNNTSRNLNYSINDKMLKIASHKLL